MPMLQSILETQGITTHSSFTARPETQPFGEGFSSLLLGYQQVRQRMGTDTDRLHATVQEEAVDFLPNQQDEKASLSALLDELVAALQNVMEGLYPENEAVKASPAESLGSDEQQVSASAVNQLSDILTNLQAILSQLDLPSSELLASQMQDGKLNVANFATRSMQGVEQALGRISPDALAEADKMGSTGLGQKMAQVLMQLKSLIQAGSEQQEAFHFPEHDKVSMQQPLKTFPHVPKDPESSGNTSQDNLETSVRLAAERTFSIENMGQLREKLQKIKHLVRQMMAHQSHGTAFGQKEPHVQMKAIQQAAHMPNVTSESQVSVAYETEHSALASIFQPFSALMGATKNKLEKIGLNTGAFFQLQNASSQRPAEAEVPLTDDAGDQASSQSGQGNPATQTLSAKSGLMQPGVTQTTLALPVRHPQWGEQLAQRVLFLAQSSQQLAQIRLHPAHLGPIQVKMKLEQDQSVQVSLHAHHALTREAIEQAVPRLRELFAQQGLNLGEIQVQADAQGHAQAFAQMRQAQQQGRSGRMQLASSEEDAIMETPAARTLQQEGLIDHFV